MMSYLNSNKLSKLITILLCSLLFSLTISFQVKAEEWHYLGTFKITHYCSCSRCCGKWGHVTRSGTTPTRYKTISVDPSVIPLGSHIFIDTYGYRTAEDTGSKVKGKHIDVYTSTHEHALDLGVQYQKVWLITESD